MVIRVEVTPLIVQTCGVPNEMGVDDMLRSDAVDGLCPVGAFCSLHKIGSLPSMRQEDEPNAYCT